MEESEPDRLRARIAELEARLAGKGEADPFRRVVESAPYGIVVSDREGRIVLVNPKAEEMFGYSREEFLTLGIEALVPFPSRGTHGLMREGFHGHPEPRAMGAGRDLQACRRDGTEFPVEIALTPLPGPEGMHVLSSIVDITERKRGEEELLRYSLRLERSNAELESFASVASHDLQEPLRKIRMMGDRLATLCGDQLGEQGRDYLGRMIRAGENMHRLIRDLLAFSRVGTGAESFRLIRLEDPVKEAISALEVLLDESGGTIRLGDLPEIEADEAQMRQLFQNLLANALKFRRPGIAPLVELSSSVVEGAEGRPLVRIEVRDNGIGFDACYRERIFQIFQRLHGKSEFEGTGIGLAICKKIVERHDGRIAAEGSPGEGSTFTVELPLRQKTALR